MTLSCSCEYDGYDGWFYHQPDDYSVLDTKKRKRCASCKELINIGDAVVKFKRGRLPKNDLELNIYGDDGEIPLANKYMCEECGDLYFSLDSLGFCVSLGGQPMRELVKEYADAYSPKKLPKDKQ